MFAQCEKGFEEYRKSDFFQSRAQTARATADGAKYRDAAYLDRRIKECRKEIMAREKNIIHYVQTLYAIENGEKKKRFGGIPVTTEVVNDWIKRELELAEKQWTSKRFWKPVLTSAAASGSVRTLLRWVIMSN